MVQIEQVVSSVCWTITVELDDPWPIDIWHVCSPWLRLGHDWKSRSQWQNMLLKWSVRPRVGFCLVFLSIFWQMAWRIAKTRTVVSTLRVVRAFIVASRLIRWRSCCVNSRRAAEHRSTIGWDFSSRTTAFRATPPSAPSTRRSFLSRRYSWTLLHRSINQSINELTNQSVNR